MDRYIGRKLDGRYQIQELIGIGGMANVYKGFDPVENRVVAIKILREEYHQNEEFLRRFRNESKAIALLGHPNIVKVYDVSLSDRMPSIVMEYIDGITLKDYIEQRGAIPWKEAVHFAVQVLRALQHAHDNGVVHRDVKPQNTMLLRDGTLKLTDFGIARFSRAASHTLTDHAIGSVHYISPEQARGETADQKSDIYSVGVLLFEMLTGRLPFDAESPVAVAVKQIETTPPRLRELNPEIPEGLEEITARAMEKEPGRRYHSAAEMLYDIAEFRRNPEISFQYQQMGEIDTMAKAGRKSPGSLATAKKKSLPVIPVLTGVTIAFVVATIAFVSMMLALNDPFARPDDVDLPNLVGLSYETVMRSERYTTQFDIRLQSTEYNEEFAAGIIFDQFPKSGKKVKAGSVIEVKVSSGAQVVTMPNFQGQEATMVFARLKELGLGNYTESRIASETIQEGYVIRTDPESGSKIPSGTPVVVYVSQGSSKVMREVPDVFRMFVDDARSTLTKAKFKVNIIYAESDQPEGTVLKQEPAAFSEAAEGSFVTLTISMGETAVKRLSILIALPSSIKQSVTMVASQDGVAVQEATLTPSIDRVWRPAFSGQGISTVRITLNGELYQEYSVDFGKGDYVITIDNSSSFRFEE